MAEWWHSFGKMEAQNWQKNDNDLAEHLCYNPNMKDWDFVLKPQFLFLYVQPLMTGIYLHLACYLAYYLALYTQIQLVLNSNIPVFK